MNPFDWLRGKTAAAVVAGFAEGLDRIERGEVAGLQERIAQALALPAPTLAAPTLPAAGEPSLAAASDGSPGAAALTTTEAPTRGKRGAK